MRLRMERQAGMNKPPYRVPSMEAIAKVPWNGLTVASTFSGCGGSCLGYKMAGFRVVWANEFVPIAQECYRANFPDTILDPRDIHQITAAEILKAIQMRPGELDVLDGSPPCQAFSTAGKREKGWGKKKEYEHGAEQCNETLFNEYIRLLRGLQPRAFVAENVSGLAKGTAKGFFLDILAQLKASGYRVKCGLLDAQWLGVPQSRQRIFFVGIREDLAGEFHFPRPLPYRYSIADALPHILGVQGANGFNHHAETPSDRPAQAFQASSAILKARVIHDTRGLPSFSEGDVTDRPSPAIMVSNGGGHFKIVYSSGFNRGSEDSVLKPVPAIMAGGMVRDTANTNCKTGICSAD